MNHENLGLRIVNKLLGPFGTNVPIYGKILLHEIFNIQYGEAKLSLSIYIKGLNFASLYLTTRYAKLSNFANFEALSKLYFS